MKRFLPILILGMIGCGPILPIGNPFEEETPPPEAITDQDQRSTLTILILDVGQGDASLVIGPNGRTLLIDAGPPEEGIRTILPTLRTLDIKNLNWIVATHYDADHIGGLAEVIRGPDLLLNTEDDPISSNGLIDRGDATDQDTSFFYDYLDAAQGHRTEAEPGMKLDLGSGASAKVVVVNGRYNNGQVIHLNPEEENEASIGLLIEFGKFHYFTAGDLTGGGSPGGYETKDMETTAGKIIGNIDVLHVGHHGSSSSTNETFLEEITPEAAVISVGKDNDYGHPTETVLARLREIGGEIYRTDEMGTLEIQTDGQNYEIAPR